MKPKSTHTSFHKGTSVHVIMRDGTAFSDKFVERESKYVVSRQAGRVKKDLVKSIGVRKTISH